MHLQQNILRLDCIISIKTVKNKPQLNMKKLLLLSLFAIAAPLLVEAQTFTVTETSQADDGWIGTCGTLPTDSDGDPITGSLAEGIARMNNGSISVIEFAIPGAGPHIINLTNINPELCSTGGLIDGNTQANLIIDGQNFAALRITGANNTIRGFEFIDIINIRGTGNTIDNCSFTNSTSHGIQINNGATNNTISNSSITGVPQKGIELQGASTSGNIIDNVTITGLGDDAIYVNGASSTTIQNSTISSNEIGINAQNAAGLIVLDNEISIHSQHGVIVQNSSNVTIDGNYVHDNCTNQPNTPGNWNGVSQYNSGTPTLSVNEQYTLNGIYLDNVTQLAINDNVVTGNIGHGIRLEDCAGGTLNTVTNNKVGVEADGITPNGNFGEGIATLGNCNIQIGGAGTGNQVCANGNASLFTGGNPAGMTPSAASSIGVQTNKMHGQGIEVRDYNGNGTVIVQGNFIGTTSDGNSTNGGAGELGNHLNGVYLVQSSGVTLGGISSGQENVIGGNGFAFQGVHTSDSQTDGGQNTGGTSFTNIYYGVRHGVQLDVGNNNKLYGNHIGIGLDGTSNLANSEDGISILGYGGSTTGNEIGGATSNHGNLIGGSNFGVAFQGGNATGNTVYNNVIGGSSLTASPLVPILTAAIKLQSGSNGNFIGNTTTGNIIIGNTKAVEVFGTGSIENDIRGNSMVCNSTAIDLYSNGNNEFGPVHFNVSEDRPGFISGFTPNIGDRVDIYLNDTCGNKQTCQESSTFGVNSNINHAGMEFIDDVITTTDDEFSNENGWALWEYDISGIATANFNNVVITATDAAGNTSEFHTCISITNCDPPTDLTVSTPDDEICTGETTTITATPVGEAGTDYQFTLYEGSVGGTLIAGPQDDSVFTVNASGNYYVLVQDKRDLAACTIDNTGDPVVITLFDTPSNLTISGDDVVCFGEDGVQYNAAPAGGGFTYTWTVPTGTSLTGQGTDQITVDFGTAAAGNKIISVQGNNNGCLGAIDEFDVAVRALPTGQSIDGAISVCASSNSLYTADPNNITSTYSWSIVSGPATIATDASSTDGEVTLDFGATAGTVNLQFTETDADLCTSAAPTTLAITVNALPVVSAIQGPDSLCENELGNYSVSGAGLTYDWTVVNGSPTVGTGSSLSITAGTAGTLEVSVSATNNTTTCQSATPSTKSVVVNALPLALTISGEDTICAEETDITYSVDTPNPNSTYQWTVTNGAAITLGNGTDNIVVDFVSPSVTTGTGSVAVTETNEFGCANTSPDAIFPIEVFGLPVVGAITGDSLPQCSEVGLIYSVTPNAGSIYIWTAPTDAVITSGDSTNTITVDMSTKNGAIRVYEISASGCVGPVKPLNIVLQNCDLTAFFEVENTTCQGDVVTYIDQSSGDSISSWIWDFGAGAFPATAVGQGPHDVTYSTSGPKTASLIVENPAKTDTFTLIGAITVKQLPSVAVLSGPTELCELSNGVLFNVLNAEIGANYNWSVSPPVDNGISTQSLPVGDSAWIDFGSTDDVVNVIVESELNDCFADTTIQVTINDRPVTGDISGDSVVCALDDNVTYSVPDNAGSVFVWTVPNGATIVSGDSTNQITVNFGTTGGQITVLETNSSGCADITGVSSFNVSVEAVPSQPGISGPASVCVGDQETYTVNGNAGSTYEWLNVPSTATDTTGNTVSITFPDNPSVDALVVREITEFGCESEIAQLTITSNALPVDLEIEGSEFGCEGQSFVYSVNNTTGSTYDWTVTGSASVVSTPNDSSSVEIEFGSQSTLITVTETNAAGCSSAVPATKSVYITPNVGSLSFSVPQGQVCDANSELVYNVTITATNATSFGLVSDPVDALIIESDNGSGVYTVSFDPDHVGPIKLFGTAENECTTQGPREVPITIEESMGQQVDIMTSPVCAGSVATFVATLSTADQKGDFTWFYNGDTIVDQSDDTLMVSQISGVDIVQGDTFTVVSNASICIWEDLSDLSADTTAHILDLPTAIAYAQSEEDKDFYDLDELIFDNIVSVPIVNLIGSDKIEDPGSTEGDDVTYQWNYWNDEVTQDSLITLELTGSTEINASIVPPRDETTFFLTVDNGVCTSTNSVKVVLDFEIFIPDAFSPNGDDSYEEWAIKNIERFPGKHIQVYNRWGNLVYDNIEDAGGSLEPWKGTHDGKDLPMGTYFYIVDLKIEGREAYRKDVSILR